MEQIFWICSQQTWALPQTGTTANRHRCYTVIKVIPEIFTLILHLCLSH